MDSLLGASLIGAGSNVLGSLASGLVSYAQASGQNDYNWAASYLNNQTNIALAQMENAYNWTLYNYNNLYNSPAWQLKRLKQAGLSDAAAAQSVAGFEAQAPQSASLANQQAPPPAVAPDLTQSLQGLMSAFDLFGHMRQLAAYRKEQAEADTAETEANLREETILTENDAKQWTINLAKQQFENTAKSFPYSLKALKYEAAASKWLPQAAAIAYRQQKQNLRLAKQNFRFLEEMNKKTLLKMSEEIKNLFKTGQNLDKEGNLISAQTDQVVEQTEGQKIENKIKGLQEVLTRFGCPESTAQKIGALVVSGKVSPEQVQKSMQSISDYLKTGGRVFDGSDDLRSFFLNVINEGTAEENKQGFYNTGFLRNILNTFKGKSVR